MTSDGAKDGSETTADDAAAEGEEPGISFAARFVASRSCISPRSSPYLDLYLDYPLRYGTPHREVQAPQEPEHCSIGALHLSPQPVESRAVRVEGQAAGQRQPNTAPLMRIIDHERGIGVVPIWQRPVGGKRDDNSLPLGDQHVPGSHRSEEGVGNAQAGGMEALGKAAQGEALEEGPDLRPVLFLEWPNDHLAAAAQLDSLFATCAGTETGLSLFWVCLPGLSKLAHDFSLSSHFEFPFSLQHFGHQWVSVHFRSLLGVYASPGRHCP